MASKDQDDDREAKPRSPSFLEAKEIKRLMGILSAAGGLELEIEDKGRRLRIRMPEPQSRTEFVPVPSAPFPGYAPAAAPPPPGLQAGEASSEAEELPQNASYINSPMVGTFYRASSPETEVFVNVGDHVDPDSTVCILEAMKVMNEIKAECSGEVVDILVENGDPVEFGQPILLVKKG